jgi:sugar fermentation stimulation protein A
MSEHHIVFEPELTPGRLIRRYKRFLADVRLDDGREVVAHCMNTGSMLGCVAEDSRVWLSHHDDPKRKLKWTWQIASDQDVRVGINTQLPNALAAKAAMQGDIPALAGYAGIRREVRYGTEKSRIDLLLEGHPEDPRPCYVEVKNVTLVENGVAMFPDAVTSRGLKHLRELSRLVVDGSRAVMFYLIQRSDAESFEPARHIDAAYGNGFDVAMAHGVEIQAWMARVTPKGVGLGTSVAVRLKST